MAAIIVVLTPSKAISEYKDFAKDVAAYWRCQISDAVWIIDSELDLGVIEKELSVHLNKYDKLLVQYLAPKWAVNNDDRLNDWLSASSRRWLKTIPSSLFARLLGR